MADKLYRAISVDNTETNDVLATKLESALNRMDDEGYKPEPGLVFRNGHHVVLVGKRKRRPAKAK